MNKIIRTRINLSVELMTMFPQDIMLAMQIDHFLYRFTNGSFGELDDDPANDIDPMNVTGRYKISHSQDRIVVKSVFDKSTRVRDISASLVKY